MVATASAAATTSALEIGFIWVMVVRLRRLLGGLRLHGCFCISGTELRLRLLADVRRESNVRPRRRHADVSLHLLVECRAEVRAVERVDTGQRRYPHDRARLARRQNQLRR